jgi:hypothetical protein
MDASVIIENDELREALTAERAKVKLLREALVDMTDFVASKFEDVDENEDCDSLSGTLCGECQSDGCISLKLKTSRAALKSTEE